MEKDLHGENAIQVFENPAFGAVRTLEENGTILFCASDVAKALGYSNPNKAVSDHCRGDLTNRYPILDSLGRTQRAIFITEGDVYRLIVRSKLPDAEKFERWVFDEVLPCIRKHRVYATDELIDRMIGDPDMAIRMLQEIKEERRKVKALEKQAEEDRPKVLFADAVSVSTTAILVGDLAKLLRQNGMDVGQNRMFEVLRRDGFLIKDGTRKNMPTQRAMDIGLFRVKERAISNPDGTVRITMTTLITGKGQQFLVDWYLGRARA